jgi:hypothetical protein
LRNCKLDWTYVTEIEDIMKHFKNCVTCGVDYSEPLLRCPECFSKLLRTDSEIIHRDWLPKEIDLTKPIEEVAWEAACNIVRAGPELTGYAQPKQWTLYIGDKGVGGRWNSEEEVLRSNTCISYREIISALICRLLNLASKYMDK